MSGPAKPFSLQLAEESHPVKSGCCGENGHHDHDHHHSHHDHAEPTTEALMQAILCGSLGLVGFLIYWGGKIDIILAPKFHLWLLAGSVALLVLSAIRVFGVWKTLKKPAASKEGHGCCGHDHGHNHPHDHGHGHHHDHDHSDANGPDKKPCSTHSCGHDHSHSYEPVKAVILMIPVGLFLLNLPNSTFAAMKELDLNNIDVNTDIKDKGAANNVNFLQLERAAQNADARQLYEGKTVTLVGQFAGADDKKFTLIRYKMNCCAADAVPLNAAIFVDPKSPAKLKSKEWAKEWVKVKGQVQFLKMKDGQYVTALVLKPTSDEDLNGEWIQKTTPDSIYLGN